MNERFKELAELAELNTTLLFNKDKLERFAESIVRECARVGSQSMYPDSDPDYVGCKIRTHFGVE